MRSCGGSDNPNPRTPTIDNNPKVVTLYDTIFKDKPIYIPKWNDRVTVDTVPADIDTLSILKDYYAKYFYTDTLHIDTLGYAVVNDTISRNKVLSRSVTTNILIPNTTVTNTIYTNKRELYWGLGLAGKSSQLNYLGGGIMLKTKKKQIYGLGIGVNQNFEPIISGHMYWKIGK
tara:strand:- start:1402 stop:1923 length:522 start_codon:yes stop_codon:yes gene_type:complete